MRSYLVLGLSLSLLTLGLGCSDSDDNGTGGSGGSAGTGGSGGSAGTGGTGGSTGGTGGNPDQCTGDGVLGITFGCANSFTGQISIIPADLNVGVETVPIAGGSEFGATLGGTVFFPEVFLDVAQGVIPGGVREATLADAKVIVQVRSGATESAGGGGMGGDGGAGGDGGMGGGGGAAGMVSQSLVPKGVETPGVVLLADIDALVPGLVTSCEFVPEDTCDPSLDNPDGSNPDCIPVFPDNTCNASVLVDVPVSEDCAPGGECDSLGKIDQCDDNGFCVNGDLSLPLEEVEQLYQADASGAVLFGFADMGLANNTLGPDDIYDIPTPNVSNPLEQGVIVAVGSIVVGIECVMAVEITGEETQAGLTPDGDLLSCPIE